MGVIVCEPLKCGHPYNQVTLLVQWVARLEGVRHQERQSKGYVQDVAAVTASVLWREAIELHCSTSYPKGKKVLFASSV